ncbi:MAG TPA: response regulator [Bradyrhizobium sp.]|nr:response regulator [Bradyrhizobium sp.]
MSEPHSPAPPPLSPIERPRCPKCQSRTMLARISPGSTGLEIRTFECPKCERVLTMTVATDPMKSEASGWLASELKPPE